MTVRARVDCSNGEVTHRILTAEDEAKIAEMELAAAASAAAEVARQTTIRNARPAAAVLLKLKNGDALTAGEMQAVVRWLAIREAREILD